MFIEIEKLSEKIKSRTDEIIAFVASKHSVEEDGFISMLALAVLGDHAKDKLKEITEIATSLHESICSCDKQKH